LRKRAKCKRLVGPCVCVDTARIAAIHAQGWSCAQIAYEH